MNRKTVQTVERKSRLIISFATVAAVIGCASADTGADIGYKFMPFADAIAQVIDENDERVRSGSNEGFINLGLDNRIAICTLSGRAYEILQASYENGSICGTIATDSQKQQCFNLRELHTVGRAYRTKVNPAENRQSVLQKTCMASFKP